MRFLYRVSFSRLVAGLLGICTSCVFSPDDEVNFVEINQEVNLPPLFIDLENANDTLYVYAPVVLKYHIKGVEANRQYSIQFMADQSPTILSDFEGSFTYNPPLDKQGYSIAKLQVFTKSGTGSFADKYDLEKVVYEKQWVMYVDTKSTQALPITSVKAENGTLRIDWPKYNRSNFKSYTLVKNRKNVWGDYTMSKVINDPDSAFYFDRSFVGGEATYWVVLDTYLYQAEGARFKYVDNTVSSVISTSNVTDSTVRVTWSRSKYYANIAKYSLLETTQTNVTSLPYETNNPSDTVTIINTIFGSIRHLSVQSFAKSTSLSNQNKDAIISDNKAFALGEIIPDYDEIFFSVSTGRYLLTKAKYPERVTTITSYAYKDNKVLNLFTFPHIVHQISVSPGQDKLLVLSGAAIYIYDLVSFTLVKKIDFSSRLNKNEFISGVGLTNDDTTLLLGKGLGDVNQHTNLIFYDLATDTQLKEFTDFSSSKYISLSADNNYVLLSGSFNWVFKIDNTTLTRIWTTGYPSIFIFNPGNNSEMLQFDNGMYSVFDLNLSDVTQRTINKQIPIPVSIDIENKQLLGYAGLPGGNAVYTQVYDYSQQKTRLKIRAETSGAFSYNYTISNGYMFSSGGTRLTLPK